VNTIAGFKERKKDKKNDSEKDGLSRSEIRKILKEKKRELKLENGQ
jgi:hypothetical protein